MRRRLVCLWALGCALGAMPRWSSAQSSDSVLATGLRAYKNLEFDLAAWLLRRDVTQLTAAGAPAAERAKGLVYLGAAELYRGRRDSAVAVFRRLVMLDPRYRPDRLVFPPEVTSLFDDVRLQTRTAAVEVPRDTTITPGAGTFAIKVVASSFQAVEVTLRATEGALLRALYVGPVGDSVNVQCDGLDGAGQPPTVNRLMLRVASRAPTGELAGIIQIPLDVRQSRLDTLPWPPPDGLRVLAGARQGRSRGAGAVGRLAPVWRRGDAPRNRRRHGHSERPAPRCGGNDRSGRLGRLRAASAWPAARGERACQPGPTGRVAAAGRRDPGGQRAAPPRRPPGGPGG